MECPVCGGTMVYIGDGWWKCNNCGHDVGKPEEKDAS
jgi:tRNA(Ile2) C34 agmatinyltransferase TiaS